MKKRILALLLCLSMLLPMFTGSVVASNEDYSANVGKYAKLADTGYGFQVGNFTDITMGNDAFLLYEEFEPGTIFQITDWYLDSATSSLWYEVKVYSGGVIPESQAYWPAMPWMLQNYLGEAAESNALIFIDTCDTCGKPDCGGHESVGSTNVYLNGEEVSQVAMPQFNKPTLSAATTLEGDISYRWQILADVGSQLWVNIYGENKPELTLTYGMVATLLDSNNQAWVRCVTTAGGAESVSDALLITVEPYVAPIRENAPPPAYLPPEPPSEPTEEPSAPMEIPTEPTEESSEPTEAPSAPTEEPSEPAEEPSVPTEVPTEPATEPSAPTEPVEAVAEDAEEPSAPAEKPLTQEVMRLLPLEQRIPSSASDAGIEGGNNELTRYDIIVTYIFEGTETTAAPNYTATVGHGDSFTETITFPTVPGYEPVLEINGVELPQDSYTFNIPSVTENVTLVVKYQPALVPYRVYVHLQNVENDNYPESVIVDSSLAYTGSTNYEFDQERTKYPGFYQLPYDKPPIAADGSTTVEIYFDRLYYLMKFDQDGGYGVEPIYARYGTPLSVPTPTKAGYDFIGWDKNGDGKSDDLPTTMPHENTTYKALWKEEGTVKVTVVFWGENADDELYSFLPDYTKEVYVKPGTSFTYSENADLVCGYATEHTHSAACGYSCGLENHDHSIENNCYTLTCPLEEHTHSESCNTCNVENHNHTTSCYQDVGDQDDPWWDAPSNPAEGQVYTINFWGTTSYIYIDGSWYLYTGRTSGGNIAPTTCGKTEQTHTHTEACIGCGKIEHTHNIDDDCYDTAPTCGKVAHAHSDLCYNCGQNEHSHSNNCHLNQNRPDHALWTFVKSDTVTVEHDGTSVVNVYYDRTTFTMTFKKEGSNGNTLGSITTKWGQTIRSEFESISKQNTFFWSTSKNGGSPWTSFMDIMPSENRTYYADPQSGSTNITATYYGQTLNGDYDVLYTVSFKGSSTITVSKEEFVEIEGYIFNASKSSKTGDRYNGSKFYYDLQTFALTFNNGLGGVRTERPMYGQSLAEYASYIPPAPDIYEPGSVEFDGWYQNKQCTGEEYVLTEHTMPANALQLYAKWKKASHTVQVYRTAEDAQNKVNQIGETQIILHGNLATEPDKPKNEPYQFVGWFYTMDGKEHAFDFDNMPVVRDLVLYAKWSSTVMVDYTVRYLKDGTTESIVPDTTGSSLAGYNKTFEAAEAPDGWFPTVKSHGMTLDLDETKNVCTFYYVQQEAVPYTVRYVTKVNGVEVDLSSVVDDAPATKVVSDNLKAVVTENFVPVPGYLPDASQKRLVVSADGMGNVITFIYTKDEVNSYYIVSNWLQNTDGTTWTQYIREEGPGKIGTHYERNPQTIPGFTYDEDHADNLSSGTLEKDKILRLNFYYTRNKYPYQIRYLEHGTDKKLAEPETFENDNAAYYGDAVNAEGKQIPTIDGYKLHSVVGCTIGMETNVENLHQNVVKVYYVPVTGSLKITKQIDVINDNAPDPFDEEFEFLIDVPNGNYPVTIGGNKETVTVTDGTLKVYLHDGESAIIDGLPQGPSNEKHQYTITETKVPGFNSTFSPAGPYTVSDGKTTSVTCTNQYPVGNLEITKKVRKEYPGDTWTSGTFDFTVTSDDLPNSKSYMVSVNGGEATKHWVLNHTLTISDIAVNSETPEVTIAIANVPAGSYTVAEKETTALKAAYDTTANGNTGRSATVDVTASNTPATVEFVNTFKRTTGDLYVSKTIEIVPNSGATLDPEAEFTFTVQFPDDVDKKHYTSYKVTGHTPANATDKITEVDVDDNGKFTFVLKHGEHLVIEDLPVGSYVITEAPATGYASSFPTPNPVDGSVSETVTITTNAQRKLECVNTYPVHIGNLEITKTVENKSVLARELTDTFTFQVTFPVKGTNRSFPATLTKQDNSKATVTPAISESNGNVTLTVSLKDGESILIEKLPQGECTVTEVNIPVGYTAQYDGSVTIAPNQTQTLEVVNTYDPPSLTIQRTNAQPSEPGQVFVYEVNKLDENGNAVEIITVTVTGNGSTTIHGLVPGTYTVTQKNLWSWRYNDTAKTFDLPADGKTITFSNVMVKDSWLDGNSTLVKNQYKPTGG